MSQSSPSYSPHLTYNYTRRVLLAIVLTASVLIAILLIVVMLIASCLSRRVHRACLSSRAQRVVSYLPTFLCFRAKCGSSIYRYTLDIKNRTGLSHYAWNPLRVCERDESTCCDVLCLDSQRDRSAMIRVIRSPFALTRLRPEGNALIQLRPEGKCPDMAASRREMP